MTVRVLRERVEIAEIDAIPLGRVLDTRFANARESIDTAEYCPVRVETVNDAVGWGGCRGTTAGNRGRSSPPARRSDLSLLAYSLA